MTAMLMLLAPIKHLAEINPHVQRGLAAAESVFGLMDTPPEEDSGHVAIGRARGEVTFEDVHFVYPTRVEPALERPEDSRADDHLDPCAVARLLRLACDHAGRRGGAGGAAVRGREARRVDPAARLRRQQRVHGRVVAALPCAGELPGDADRRRCPSVHDQRDDHDQEDRGGERGRPSMGQSPLSLG